MRNEEVTIVYLADGSSVHTKAFLKYFAQRGYNVHLITYTSSEIEKVKIHKVANPRIMLPLRVIQTINIIRKISPTVMHALYVTNNGFVGAVSGFHPLIITQWGSDITTDPEKSRIFRFLVKYAIGKADLVHASDDFSKTRLIELGCHLEKIIVNYFGVDTNLFSPRARSEPLRKKLGIDDKYSVLCARYWRSLYDVSVLINAIPFVLEKIADVRFILLGGGPLERELKELAERLGVFQNISFVGKVNPEEMSNYLASVDVYVDTASMYRPDALGNITLARGDSGIGQTTRETMSCATPVILSDTAGLTTNELFRGLTYKQRDPVDLAETITRLLRDEKLRQNLGFESRAAILKFCDLEKTMGKWETIYHGLAASYCDNLRKSCGKQGSTPPGRS